MVRRSSPGFVCKIYFDPELDVIVESTANSYAVPADWARTIADLATGRAGEGPWGALVAAPPTVAADDPRLGRYSSRGRDTVFERNARGAMFVHDPRGESTTAFVPLADGSFLLPIYFQRCEQAEDRAVTCRMLSGDESYTGTYTPLGD